MMVFALTLVAQVGAAVQPQAFSRCEEECPDGDESGHCPPACNCACLCHTPKQPAQAQVVPERLAVIVARAAPANDDSPVCPDLEPMRHVPKDAA